MFERLADSLAIGLAQRQAEEALKESEEKFRSIFEISPYSKVLLDLNGVIQQCNQRFVRFHATKKGAEAQVGRKISEFFPPEERQKLFDAIEKTIQERKTVVGPIEYVMLREDGSRFPAEGFSIVMEDEHGLPKAVLGLACDITERKRAEEKLLEYQGKLKAMASKILQTEEREKHRLAVGLHDDICQKLVLTKLALESTLNSISDAKLLASLRIACGAIGETIEEADSLTFALSNPILHQFGFIAALEKYLTEEIQQKYGITYELDSGKRLGTLDDEIRTCLFRVTRELLTNVVRHAHASEVKVFVHKRRGQISVRVQDDGVGFKCAEVGPGTYKAARFGLFSIREQLEYLGGRLEIESEPGKGTTVTVVISERKSVIV
jgi:PAS domain S-box-containing protein